MWYIGNKNWLKLVKEFFLLQKRIDILSMKKTAYIYILFQLNLNFREHILGRDFCILKHQTPFLVNVHC